MGEPPGSGQQFASAQLFLRVWQLHGRIGCGLGSCMSGSCFLQPLDVSCFSPLKHLYGQRVQELIQKRIYSIKKEDFLYIYPAVHQQALSSSNIKIGFSMYFLLQVYIRNPHITLYTMARSFPNKIKRIAWRKRIIWRKKIAWRQQLFSSKSKSLAPCPTERNAEVSKKIFCYLPKDRIRLIKLHPGSLNDGIKCDVHEATLSDPRASYHALSYVWGNFEKAEYIDLNSERFCVTRNLAEALRRLRNANCETIMWIDALCINQTDDKEKSTQVPLMGLVYEKAESVIAFLGEHDETSPILFKFLRYLEGTGDMKRVLGALNSDERDTIFPALHTFLHREYWKRAWIVQELILNQNKWIQCGSDKVSYLTMEDFKETGLSYISTDIPPTDPSPIHGVGYPIEWPPRFQQLGSLGRELSADGFLEGFLDVRCSDPRDYIYAFYNLLPVIKKHMGVDYKKNRRKSFAKQQSLSSWKPRVYI